MKKLSKLVINPEKVMKNEELISLKGGYDGTYCCYCYKNGDVVSAGAAEDSWWCAYDCSILWETTEYKWVC